MQIPGNTPWDHKCSGIQLHTHDLIPGTERYMQAHAHVSTREVPQSVGTGVCVHVLTCTQVEMHVDTRKNIPSLLERFPG